MDWARDQIGNLVHATQRGIFSYGLTCPACGQPVRKRAGVERRPHFAHYSYSAKPECENYYPTSQSSTSGVQRSKESSTRKEFEQGSIFLEHNERGGFSLYLKLPQLPDGMDGLGEIEICSSFGVRLYRAFQLKRPRLAPVIPEVPLVEVRSSGDLTAFGSAIKLLVEGFRNSDNYFAVNGTVGRLLSPKEPLEWGESYWLLTKYPLRQMPTDIRLKVNSEGLQRGWYTYRIDLPCFSQVPSESEKVVLAGFLGRTLKHPRARAYFVDPPPHHIGPDGTHIFPEGTERILIRRTEANDIFIEGSPQAVSAASVQYLTDEWAEIRGMGAGDFAIHLDGGERLFGRIDECELFQPRGVRVAFGDDTWEIFEPKFKDSIQERLREGLRIECPSQRVADSLALGQEVWAQKGTCYEFCGTTSCDVDAANFGTLIRPVQEAQKSSPGLMTSDPQVMARRAWLDGVVARYYGPGVMILGPEKPTGGNRGIALRDLAGLRPHIQLNRSSE